MQRAKAVLSNIMQVRISAGSLDYFQIFSKWVGGVGKSETGLTILPFIHSSTKGFNLEQM